MNWNKMSKNSMKWPQNTFDEAKKKGKIVTKSGQLQTDNVSKSGQNLKKKVSKQTQEWTYELTKNSH